MAIGNPVSTTSSSVASKTSSVIATAGQTLFTVPAGYVTNHISVFRNGIRLVDGRDYEARNGATVTLLAAATVGDFGLETPGFTNLYACNLATRCLLLLHSTFLFFKEID